MRAQIVYGLAATRDAIGKAFGQRVADMFIPNPAVSEYAAVVRFPALKVIVSGEVGRALRKVVARPGPKLVIAHDVTIEGRAIATDAGCDVLTSKEFGWTDARYEHIRRTY